MDPHHLRDRQTKEAQRQGRQDELQIIGFSVEGGLEDGRGQRFFLQTKPKGSKCLKSCLECKSYTVVSGLLGLLPPITKWFKHAETQSQSRT